jgi:arginyl-tRNA synthetase
VHSPISIKFLYRVQAAKVAGWVASDGVNKLSKAPKHTSLEHAAFGVVTGVDGKKLSSRAGTEYTLHGLLHDGIAQVATSMQQTSMSAEEKARTASAIACGAIRYYDLAHNRKSNYEFCFDRVLSLKGNTAAYLMYATTRLSSLRRQFAVAQKLLPHAEPTWEEIMAFVQKHQTGPAGSKTSTEWAPAERALVLELLRFPESVQHASKALLPNIFTDYLHNLATCFHGFYEACRVVPAESAELSQPTTLWRIALCAASENTLRAGFSLVGISHVSRM